MYTQDPCTVAEYGTNEFIKQFTFKDTGKSISPNIERRFM